MKNKYYKTISPSLAKRRIARLVKKKHEAFNDYTEAKELGLKNTDEYYLTKAIGYADSLRAMGIVCADILED